MKSRLLSLANQLLGAARLKLVRHHSLYEWQASSDDGLTQTRAGEGPRPNARLRELEERYRSFDAQVTTPAEWPEGTVTEADLVNFRGDNPYVWQRLNLNSNDVAYALTYFYLKAGSDLLDRMAEDGAFGARTVEIDGRLVSRDLLDSASEIDFLTRHLGSRFSILDIGAGYGRLAHRLSETTDARIFTTDAFAPSTFLSEYYLAHRKVDARVIPLDEVDAFLADQQIDVATNIHSFSECRIEAIDWWVSRLAAANVKNLMIVPNTGLERCIANDGSDMEAVFAKYDYSPKVRKPRHADPLLQRYGVDPSWFHLFTL